MAFTCPLLLLILQLLVLTPLCHPYLAALPQSRHLFKALSHPVHETALQLLCPGVALSLPCPGEEHPQLPSLYRLHPCLSEPHKLCNEPKTITLVHCPELSLSMTSMLSRGHKIFPLPRRHHMVIVQTKMVSPSTMMIMTIPSLSTPLLMNLTLMRYLLTRMKGWLKRHCMPQV